jgi:hypothetical protein
LGADKEYLSYKLTLTSTHMNPASFSIRKLIFRDRIYGTQERGVSKPSLSEKIEDSTVNSITNPI